MNKTCTKRPGKIHTTVRTQQLIASLKNVFLSCKAFAKAPKSHLLQFQQKLGASILGAEKWLKNFQPAPFVPAISVLFFTVILVGESKPREYSTEISKAGLTSEEGTKDKHLSASSLFDDIPAGESIPQDNKTLTKEALRWLYVLGTYNDFSLSNEQLATKFKDMGIASTIISLTADGPIRKKYWSERAVTYGRRSVGVMTGMVPHPNELDLEEIHTRLLIAMAVNYYEGGDISEEDLSEQFENISKTFLLRTGFCNNKILRALDDDSIIRLPQLSLI